MGSNPSGYKSIKKTHKLVFVTFPLNTRATFRNPSLSALSQNSVSELIDMDFYGQ